MLALPGTPNFDTGNASLASGKLTVVKAGGGTLLVNRLPEEVSYIVRVTCF